SATICSLPRFLESNALPAGCDLERFARRVEERSARVYPRLPTGVGVCLYIKRKALLALGLFDEKSFGLGYGEESEFCMRALKAGYAHILDDATFLYHEGQRSFGTSRGKRVAAAHRVMRRLHPEYMATVAAFLAADPLRPLRERVLAGLSPPRRQIRPPQRVLHIVHGWPPATHAGTELYAAWLARRQATYREVTVYARWADPERPKGEARELLDSGVRVRLTVNNFLQRDPLSRNALYDRDFAADLGRLLREVDPQLVHIHHLAGHALALLPQIARTGVPIVYQVQDWWAACARANLLDRDRHPCSGPGLRKCSRCLPMTGIPPRGLWNPALYALRGRLAHHALRLPSAFVMGSRAIEEDYRRLGLLQPNDPVWVLPYGVEVAGTLRAHQAAGTFTSTSGETAGTPYDYDQAPGTSTAGNSVEMAGTSASTSTTASAGDLHQVAGTFSEGTSTAYQSAGTSSPRQVAGTSSYQVAYQVAGTSTRPLRFGFLGSLLPHKGAHVAVAAFRGVDRRAATLTLYGEASLSSSYQAELLSGLPPAVFFAGSFPEEEKARVLSGLDVLLVPSLGLESFGLAAREAMACGVPVLASRLGALTEIHAGRDCGALFTPGDVAELAGWIERLIDDPGIVDRWRAALPPVKTLAEHAEEIEAVYAAVLAGRRER
ncbi:MAG TPA: glycosyltransferase, partial [Thermoanaerobaculia bacterium]|nr:glycosyltransferase [Thermoanaerobaculia bacterium]